MTRSVSILLPVYNGARFLEQQLESIFAQSNGEFELLALDDGSLDASPAILAVAARRDRRLRLIPASGNEGQLARLSQLLAQASGRFVAVADQDDVWHPDRNRRLLGVIGDRPLAFGRSDLVDADDVALGGTLLGSLGLTPDPHAALRSLFKPMVSAHAALIRRDWIDPAILVHPLPFDWLLGAAALHGGGLAYADDAVVRHRLHGANQMNRVGPDATRPLASLRNRYAFLLRRPVQLRLWLMLDFLGRTAMVPTPRRRVLADLAGACRAAWFGGVSRPRPEDRVLRRRLADDLAPLAGSAEDWQVARRQIDLVTRSLFHPAKIGEAIRRLASPLASEF